MAVRRAVVEVADEGAERMVAQAARFEAAADRIDAAPSGNGADYDRETAATLRGRGRVLRRQAEEAQ